jgi:regulator of protease activity HflC (stomatin/prohibitin superfamily)
MNSNPDPHSGTEERVSRALSGWLMLPILFGLLFGALALLIYSIRAGLHEYRHPIWSLFWTALFVEAVSLVMSVGFFTLQPNQARVLVLFGAYKGTVRNPGFHWASPFYSNGPSQITHRLRQLSAAERGHSPESNVSSHKLSRFKISLRARNFNTEKLKVNDLRGNPIEIAAVIVWRVEETAQAMFDVEDYENYVRVQSESALRHLASVYAYDHGEENEITLRSGVDEVSQALRKELQERLSKAGVVIEEARLTHLAYAPEIAQAMLRRQQAEAVIAARQKIVQGAVSMVDMALKDLAAKQVVELDDERKAAMVSNLMVVLCGEAEVHPVVNTGTLYT